MARFARREAAFIVAAVRHRQFAAEGRRRRQLLRQPLLPDSDRIRKRLAQRFKTDSPDAFDLLAAVGRDCVGAVQLLPLDGSPSGVDRIDATPLYETEVATHLQRVVTSPVPGQGNDDDFRISLAGAQEKTALLWHAGQWCLPRGATPTTHILKLPIGLVGNMKADFTTSVENEWLCMQLLQAFGLPVEPLHAQHLLAGELQNGRPRERQVHPSGAWIMRLPQEDFCQVFGLPPTRKYEADGGPGEPAIANILRHSEDSESDIANLLRAQIRWLPRMGTPRTSASSSCPEGDTD
jgi:serine/threonine-protein kinase HipA